jgi:hypothetical protein
MINVHLNGEIIRCPDIATIKKRIAERNEAEHRCKYGMIEYHCSAWQKFVSNLPGIKLFSNYGRCSLAGSENCPGCLKRIEAGNEKKTFKIDHSIYRKLTSSAHYLVNESKTKTLFITLTFPPFRKKHKLTKKIFEDVILNQRFSRFVENLRSHYDCKGYIAVRERGEKGNRIHYHLLISLPFISFSSLNATWCNTIKDICCFSKNALTSEKKTLFIRNPVRALKYVCKYFSKCKGQSNDSRLVFISNNILTRHKILTDNPVELLKNYKSIYIEQTSDYTTRFTITDYKEFSRFCALFLYPLFELTVKKGMEFYSFPGKSP